MAYMGARNVHAAARRRPRLLVYTDSRGFDVGRWYCRKNPFRSYVSWLTDSYHVDYHIGPHRHTTLVDFIHDCDAVLARKRVDAVVLHVGIVDYSPRAARGASLLRQSKSARVAAIFGERAQRAFLPRQYAERFDNEATESLYDLCFLREWIVPYIQAISVPVIWIGVNRVNASWRGTYFRERPSNMNAILDYQADIDRSLPDSSLSLPWSATEVRTYTVDNVHLSAAGFAFVNDRIRERLSAALG
jgi:hypothetical protein